MLQLSKNKHALAYDYIYQCRGAIEGLLQSCVVFSSLMEDIMSDDQHNAQVFK